MKTQIADFAYLDRRSIAAQLRGNGDGRQLAYVAQLNRALARDPNTDLSDVARAFTAGKKGSGVLADARRRFDSIIQLIACLLGKEAGKV